MSLLPRGAPVAPYGHYTSRGGARRVRRTLHGRFPARRPRPPFAGYNANAGSRLGDGSYDGPVLNPVGIDLGRGVDGALGWRWPSSGFVLVNVSRLP